MRKLSLFILSAVLIGAVVACQKDDLGPSDEEMLVSDKTAIQDYATSKALSGTTTTSGVYYMLNKPSSSTVSPMNGQEAEFNYTLYVLSRSDGGVVTDKLVDSVYAGKSSYGYIVADNLGITEGLVRMHEGDQATILVPSYYAFGRTGSIDGKVPANVPVRFDVTLKRVRTEEQQIDEYLTANKLTPTQVTTSGLRFIKTLDNPTGTTPTATQTLVVKYAGRLLRATSAFDSTTAAFSGNTIPGFSEGLSKLKVGEKATLVFPSSLGYGSSGKQVIPPYAPLRFDVELVSVQ